MPIQIEIEEQPDLEAEDFVTRGLRAYNAATAGPPHIEDLWIMARDENGLVHGGLKARIARSWLFVERLWVADSARGQGVGRQLMERAEDAARQRKCVGVYLDTFSFQAPGFYARLGYEEFGRVAEFPPGYARIWLKKTF
jgi:GNAT superfamily N-acetyltransferase